MQRKYKTIKTLAAFTAIAGATFPLYGHAQLKGLPSIELNFDVLEKLNKPEGNNLPIKTDKNPEPEVNDWQRVVTPAPLTKKIVKTASSHKKQVLPKEDFSVEPGLVTKAIENSTPDATAEKLPIIIKKDSPAEELPVEAAVNNQQEQKKGVFDNIGGFFKKIPFVSKEPSDSAKPSDVESDTAKTEEAVKSDTYSDKSDDLKGNINQAAPADNAAINDKNPEVVEEPAKKIKKQKEVSHNPTPHLKKDSKVVLAQGKSKKVIEKPEVKTEKADDNIKEIPAPQEKPIVTLTPDNSNKTKEVEKVVAKEEQKTPEEAPFVKVEKEECANDSMWQKFLNNSRNKAFQSDSGDTKPNNKDGSDSLVYNNPAPAPSQPMVVTQIPEDGRNKTKDIKQAAAEPQVTNEKPQKPIETPKENKALTTLVSKDKESVNSSLEDKMAESKKILAEKMNNTPAKPKAEIPPVPEVASMPMEVSELTPPENAQAVTLKEIPQTTLIQANPDNKGALLSVVFDGNNIEISNADKDKINAVVKQVIASKQRLKVMSYAKGVDGEVNSSRRISLQRAIAIRTQMIQSGLDKARINVQAVGNNATNQELANSANIYIVD